MDKSPRLPVLDTRDFRNAFSGNARAVRNQTRRCSLSRTQAHGAAESR